MLITVICGGIIYLCPMRPDHPYKLFADERMSYFMLMEALAMESN